MAQVQVGIILMYLSNKLVPGIRIFIDVYFHVWKQLSAFPVEFFDAPVAVLIMTIFISVRCTRY
jgi:hypothetical protein